MKTPPFTEACGLKVDGGGLVGMGVDSRSVRRGAIPLTPSAQLVELNQLVVRYQFRELGGVGVDLLRCAVDETVFEGYQVADDLQGLQLLLGRVELPRFFGVRVTDDDVDNFFVRDDRAG